MESKLRLFVFVIISLYYIDCGPIGGPVGVNLGTNSVNEENNIPFGNVNVKRIVNGVYYGDNDKPVESSWESVAVILNKFI